MRPYLVRSGGRTVSVIITVGVNTDGWGMPGKSGRRIVSAITRHRLAQETQEAASNQWRAVADQIRPTVLKSAAI